MEKKESVNLVSIFLCFSQFLYILYKISPFLCFQTKEMYNLYAVNGFPQVIKPPQNIKAKIDATHKMLGSKPVVQRKFVLENAKHVKTKKSSTSKSSPPVSKKK